MEYPIRLNKFLAHKGYATRRSADALIESNKVLVNGKSATLGQKIYCEDVVEVKNFSVPTYTYILYYKPHGITLHHLNNDARASISEIKKKCGVDIFPIGRLDKNSEGLVLLTNDGRVTDRILSSEKDHTYEYMISVDKKVKQTFLNRLAKGVYIDGHSARPASAILCTHDEKSFLLKLSGGERYQIRSICALSGYQVTKIKRTRILGLEIKNLAPGAFYTLKRQEVERFIKSIDLM